MVQKASVLFLALWMLCSFCVVGVAVAQEDGETPAEEQYAAGDGTAGDGSCPNPVEVANVGPLTNDDRVPFETTTDRFRVSYEVDFEDDDSILFRDFTVDITDRFGLVESDSTDVDTSASFIVAEEAGTFAIETDVEPENGATYTVIVEDCGDAAGNGPGDNPGDGDDPGDGTGPEDVIDDTIPDKKVLVNTGGFPLLAGAGLLLAAATAVGTRVIGRR